MNYDLRTTLRPGTQAVHRQAHHHRVPTTDLAYAAEAIGPSLEKALPPRVRPIVGNIIENIQKMAPAQGHASNPHHSRGQGSWGTGSGQWASGSGPYTQHQSYAYHHHPHGSSPLGSTDQRTQGAGHLRGHSGDSAGGVGGLARGDRVRTGRTGLGGALMGRSVSVKNAGGDKMMQRVMRHRNKRKGKAKYASPGWKMDERQKELLQAR